MTTASTDSALAWLLSLDAICNSSPLPIPTSPDLTDWLHISPTTDSPAATALQNESVASSPFLQDVTSSSRVNVPQERDFALNYLYDLSDLSDANLTDALPSSLAPAIFNRHHRMISLESTSQTLINTPSPLRSPAFFFPSGSAGLHPEDRTSDALSPLITSPGSKSFFNYFRDLSPSALSGPTISISDISPVVRANDLERAAPVPSKKPKKKRKTRTHKPPLQPLSFVEKLQALPPHPDSLTLARPGLQDVPPPNGSTAQSALLSPCRLEPDQMWTGNDRDLDDASLLGQLVAEDSPSQQKPVSVASLSPLTPLPSSLESPIPPLKITLKLKRTVLENPTVTPLRRSKRPRKTYFPPEPESPLSSASPTLSRHSSPDPEPKSSGNISSIHTVRTFPDSIQISENFPLFYRRFPASAYYRIDDSEPFRFLSDVSPPGGLYNPPRSALDLYTPRFVRGKGVEKVGLCPICIEPHIRGGENKKLWFAMKFSAFKYYHMQYAHGISASTGRPFSPPVDFRTVVRQNPGKKEKHSIQQGKCHKCAKWVAVEGIKDMESKVKELHWWKHAAACHQDSTLEGEDDLFEEDDVLARILSFKPAEVV